jgi:hypothetical protein
VSGGEFVQFAPELADPFLASGPRMVMVMVMVESVAW